MQLPIHPSIYQSGIYAQAVGVRTPAALGHDPLTLFCNAFFAPVVHNMPLGPADRISCGASLPGVSLAGPSPRPTSDPRPREATSLEAHWQWYNNHISPGALELSSRNLATRSSAQRRVIVQCLRDRSKCVREPLSRSRA